MGTLTDTQIHDHMEALAESLEPPKMPNPLVELTVYVKYETPKAWLIDDSGKEVWIPKSQASLVTKSHSPRWIAELTLPEWLAKKGGLI